MPEWLPLVAALIGGPVGGYIAVKIAIARLETQMVDVRQEVRNLRDAKHDHAGMLTEHEMRLSALEKRPRERR